MRVYLQGLLQDGSNPSLAIDQNSAKAVAMPLGATVDVVLTVVRPDGSAVNLSGWTLYLTVRKTSDQTDRLPGFQKTVALGSPAPAPYNVATFPAIVRNDTRFLVPGRFVFDVWGIDGAGNRNQLVALSPWTILPATPLFP